MTVKDWSSTASANTSVGGISTDGTVTLVKQIDNMFRGMMADIRVGINNGSFLGTAFTTKSGNYTAVLADWGGLFHFTATATLSLTAAATLTAGWCMLVRAAGGNVTIDPNGAELINGAATQLVMSGDSVMIVCDGTGFKTFGDYTNAVGSRVLETGSISAAASKVIDLTTYIANGYSEFELDVRKIIPATDGSTLLLTVSTDSGSSFLATGYSRQFQNSEGATVSASGNSNDTSFAIGTLHGNAAGEHGNFIFRMDTSQSAFFYNSHGNYWNSGTDVFLMNLSSGRVNTVSVNAIKLAYSAGNITSATYVLRGMRVTTP